MKFSEAQVEAGKLRNQFRAFQKLEEVLATAADAEAATAKSLADKQALDAKIADLDVKLTEQADLLAAKKAAVDDRCARLDKDLASHRLEVEEDRRQLDEGLEALRMADERLKAEHETAMKTMENERAAAQTELDLAKADRDAFLTTMKERLGT